MVDTSNDVWFPFQVPNTSQYFIHFVLSWQWGKMLHKFFIRLFLNLANIRDNMWFLGRISVMFKFEPPSKCTGGILWGATNPGCLEFCLEFLTLCLILPKVSVLLQPFIFEIQIISSFYFFPWSLTVIFSPPPSPISSKQEIGPWLWDIGSNIACFSPSSNLDLQLRVTCISVKD